MIFVVLTTAKSQSKLVFKDKLMFANVQVCQENIAYLMPSLIDTGSSLCVIDSVYAIDSCGIKASTLETAFVNQNKTKISSITIDSIVFCGTTYKNVHCLVADLSGIYQKYAPKFIIGANILKQGIWKFDLKNSIIEPYDYKKKNGGTVYKWENHRSYSDVAMDYIVFEGFACGKKTRFVFDTGTRNNRLPPNIYDGPVELIEKESANISNKLSIKTMKLCRDVQFKIGKNEFMIDFVIDESTSLVFLNIEFLQGHSFILNYQKQILEVLYI